MSKYHKKGFIGIVILLLALGLGVGIMYFGGQGKGAKDVKIKSVINNNDINQGFGPTIGMEALVGDKPVIYLYPTERIKIDVRLDTSKIDGYLTTIYPKFNTENGRSVVADPSGNITLDSHQYSYLFREGIWDQEYDLNKGFVIHRDQAIEFLQDSLSRLGLLPNEYNEMIVYRLPFIEKSERNLLHFATPSEYHNIIPLDIDPAPDSLLRIFMVIQSLENNVEGIMPQQLLGFERKGFAVVERGGTYLE